MGTETNNSIRARQREAAARVDRLIAKRDRHSQMSPAGRERIKAAVRQGRRALRSRETARAAVLEAEARAGAAMARIRAEGILLDDAFETLGLSTFVGRRLLHGAAVTTRGVSVSGSTAPASGRAPSVQSLHGEAGTRTTDRAWPEGKA